MKDSWVMIPCRSAHRLISAGMDRPLGLGERLRLRLHLSMCTMCSRVDRQVHLLRDALRGAGNDPA